MRRPRPGRTLGGAPGQHPLLAGFAVAEATIFPAPTEALLVALVLGRPRRAGGLAALATVVSAAGGALGYVLGAYLFEPVAAPLLARFGGPGSLGTLQTAYRENLF